MSDRCSLVRSAGSRGSLLAALVGSWLVVAFAARAQLAGAVAGSPSLADEMRRVLRAGLGVNVDGARVWGWKIDAGGTLVVPMGVCPADSQLRVEPLAGLLPSARQLPSVCGDGYAVMPARALLDRYSRRMPFIPPIGPTPTVGESVRVIDGTWAPESSQLLHVKRAGDSEFYIAPLAGRPRPGPGALVLRRPGGRGALVAVGIVVPPSQGPGAHSDLVRAIGLIEVAALAERLPVATGPTSRVAVPSSPPSSEPSFTAAVRPSMGEGSAGHPSVPGPVESANPPQPVQLPPPPSQAQALPPAQWPSQSSAQSSARLPATGTLAGQAPGLTQVAGVAPAKARSVPAPPPPPAAGGGGERPDGPPPAAQEPGTAGAAAPTAQSAPGPTPSPSAALATAVAPAADTANMQARNATLEHRTESRGETGTMSGGGVPMGMFFIVAMVAGTLSGLLLRLARRSRGLEARLATLDDALGEIRRALADTRFRLESAGRPGEGSVAHAPHADADTQTQAMATMRAELAQVRARVETLGRDLERRSAGTGAASPDIDGIRKDLESTRTALGELRARLSQSGSNAPAAAGTLAPARADLLSPLVGRLMHESLREALRQDGSAFDATLMVPLTEMARRVASAQAAVQRSMETLIGPGQERENAREALADVLAWIGEIRSLADLVGGQGPGGGVAALVPIGLPEPTAGSLKDPQGRWSLGHALAATLDEVTRRVTDRALAVAQALAAPRSGTGIQPGGAPRAYLIARLDAIERLAIALFESSRKDADPASHGALQEAAGAIEGFLREYGLGLIVPQWGDPYEAAELSSSGSVPTPGLSQGGVVRLTALGVRDVKTGQVLRRASVMTSA